MFTPQKRYGMYKGPSEKDHAFFSFHFYTLPLKCQDGYIKWIQRKGLANLSSDVSEPKILCNRSLVRDISKSVWIRHLLKSHKLFPLLKRHICLKISRLANGKSVNPFLFVNHKVHGALWLALYTKVWFIDDEK